MKEKQKKENIQYIMFPGIRTQKFLCMTKEKKTDY